MTDPSPPGIRRRQLAIRLTELRKARGMGHAEVASWVGLSQSTISKIENARQQIAVRHVRLLAQCYNVESPELDQLLRMAEHSDDRGILVAHSDTVPSFARQYFELEPHATELWVYEPAVVFGLFQTPDYVRALTLREQPDADAADVDRSVALRAARQEILSSPTPPVIRLILDEPVLHWRLGGPSVMAAQLRHLAKLSEEKNITIQVVPLSGGGHSVTGLGFTVMRFDDTPGMDVVYAEHIRSATYLEKPADLARHVETFEAISSVALPPEASAEMLSTLSVDLWEHPRKGQA